METERLEIRPIDEMDEGRFVEMASEAKFMFGLDEYRDNPVEWFRQLMRRSQSNGPCAEQAVVRKDNGKIVGYAGAAPWVERPPRFEFTYRFVKCGRGQGFAQEACEALLGLWDQVNGGEMFGRIDEDNPDSTDLALRLGFVRVISEEEILKGNKRRHIYRRDAQGK
jgi:RimJ/RimL family protein N-acetyltransferase